MFFVALLLSDFRNYTEHRIVINFNIFIELRLNYLNKILKCFFCLTLAGKMTN